MHISIDIHRKMVRRMLTVILLLTVALIGVLFYAKSQVVEYRSELRELGWSSADSHDLGLVRKEPSPFLEEEEVVIVPADATSTKEQVIPIEKVLFEYIEIVDSCGTHYEGECVNARLGPGTDYPVIAQLRNNVILKIDGVVERDGYDWYRVVFDEWLRYPERVQGDWYVSSDYAEVLLNEGDRSAYGDALPTTTKKIIVDRSKQKLYAYEGEALVLEVAVSTGRELTPTPRGTFSVFKKTPSRYMQGPIPGIAEQYYDMPGVPWNLYFTHGGAVIHGAYWHDSFGSTYSHGCVNLPPDIAKQLYHWADLGTTVVVRD